MNRLVLAALFSLVFFSAYASADAVCGVNPIVNGLEDCGVDYDSDNDGIFETHYNSLPDFMTNGFPNNINLGDEVSFRLQMRNTLAVPSINNSSQCYFWQTTPDATVELVNFDFTTVTLNPAQTGYSQVDLVFDGMLMYNEATGNQIQCLGYNQQAAIFTSQSKWGLVLDPNLGPNISISNIVVPPDNCPSGLCLNLFDTIQLQYQITNNSPANLGPFTVKYRVMHGWPLTRRGLGWFCSFAEGDVGGEGADFLAASGNPGSTKTYDCTYFISFLEGFSSMLGESTIDVGTRESEAQVRRDYTVSGPAYIFTRLSPFSIYENVGGDLEVSYRIEPEPGIAPQQVYIVAEVREDGAPDWTEAFRWGYFWAGPGDRDQVLVGFDPSPILGVGRKYIRLMAFDGLFPIVIPNPISAYFSAPPSSYNSALLNWAETIFYIARMLQPDEEAYFPSGNIYNMSEGPFTLGLRNLSDVSNLPGPPTVDYDLTLISGDFTRITDVDIGCDAVIEFPVWQDIFGISFSDVEPEETFIGPLFGGNAPGLNEEICMNISAGSFEFRLEATNDVAGTSLNEQDLVEQLELNVAGCGDGVVVAPEECEQDADCFVGTCAADCTCINLSCSVDSIVPDPVSVGDDAVVTVSYTNFSALPVDDILRCGLNPLPGSGATPANFACVGLPDGTCTYDCQNYLNPGVYIDVFTQVTEGVAGPSVDCGAVPITVIGVINVIPNADAGPDQVTTSGASVSLSGSCDDTDGTIADCDWGAAPVGCVYDFAEVKAGLGTPNATSDVDVTCVGAVGSTFDFTLTATDDGAATASDDMTVTIALVANVAPFANAGFDQPTLSGVSVSLNGSCDDIDGTIADCDWGAAPVGCVYDFAEVKAGLGTPNATSDVDVTCVGAVGSTFDFTLTATDDDTAIDSDDTTVTISAPIVLEPDLEILSFEIFPSEVIFDGPGAETIDPIVKVTNWGDFEQATLEIRVLDSAGNTVALQSASRGIPADTVVVFSPPADAISFVVPSDWEPGIYAVYANVFDSGGELHDSAVRFLNVSGWRIPLPEGSPLLLPLIAFSVLAVIFLSRKRSS